MSTVTPIISEISKTPNLTELMRIGKKYDKFKTTWDKIKNNPFHKDYSKCINIYVSSFKIFGREDKTISVASLTKGSNTYLPKVDYICFTDLNTGLVKFLSFGSFIEFTKLKSINVKGDKEVVYYICEGLPEDFDTFVEQNSVTL